MLSVWQRHTVDHLFMYLRSQANLLQSSSMEVLPTPRRLENRSNQINKMIILLMAFSHNLHNLARYVYSFDSYIFIITMESMHVQCMYLCGQQAQSQYCKVTVQSQIRLPQQFEKSVHQPGCQYMYTRHEQASRVAITITMYTIGVINGAVTGVCMLTSNTQPSRAKISGRQKRQKPQNPCRSEGQSSRLLQYTSA